MRFMIIVKATRDSEAGVMPPEHLLAEMAAYHGELAKAGVAAKGAQPAAGAKAALIELETPGKPSDFRIGFDNFYVITRYNRSSFYATSVADLGAALRARYPGGR